MKAGTSVCAALLLFGCARLLGGVPSKENQRTRNVTGMSLMEAFDQGAQIYLATEVERLTFPESSSRNLQLGIVTLRVNETLRGSAMDSIRVPYCYFNSFGSLSFKWLDLVWTNEGTKFTCILVPQGWDATLHYADDSEAVAAFTWAHKTPEDASASVARMRKLVEIYDGAREPEFAKRIKEFAKDDDILVGGFAMEVAVIKASQLPPETVLGLLANAVRAPRHGSHACDTNVLKGLVNSVAGRIGRHEDKDRYDVLALRCLAVLAQCPNEAVRTASIDKIAYVIRGYLTIPQVQSLGPDGLSVSEKEDLRRVLKVVPVHPSARAVEKWLEG